jgi:hypothetical protein
MRKCIVALVILTALFACKNKKVSLKTGEQVELNDFVDAFPKTDLPFTVTDTNMQNVADTNTIDYSIFSQFAPDTVLLQPFGKDRKVTIYPAARFEAKDKEKYLVTYVRSKTKEAVYLIVLDNKNKFSAFLPLVSTSAEKGTVTTASIDKKFGININKDWKVDEMMYYQRNTYAYNDVGLFTLVLNETNDQRKKPETEVNPLDTFPKKNKFSGDYFKGKTNFISLRDGKNDQTYRFFVHFENENEDKCSGELRGELFITSATTAVYKENGDPCVIDFTLTGNQVKVKEQGSCGNYRGIKCFFNDTYTKKKEPKPEKKKK